MYRKVNKDFFKKWSREMAYVLGFFAADGYITVNKRGGQFWSIQIVDKDLLQKIKETVDSDHKISTMLRRDKIISKKIYKIFRLQIGSKEMCNDLRKLGMRENKTKSLSVPDVPQKYFFDFVRGYFDGDGNVWKGLLHKERKTQTLTIFVMFTSCSLNFLTVLRLKIREFGIKGGSIYKAKGNYYRLLFSCLDSMKLFKFMYNKLDNELFLERKRIVFKKYVILKNAPVV